MRSLRRTRLVAFPISLFFALACQGPADTGHAGPGSGGQGSGGSGSASGGALNLAGGAPLPRNVVPTALLPAGIRRLTDAE